MMMQDSTLCLLTLAVAICFFFKYIRFCNSVLLLKNRLKESKQTEINDK